MSEVAGQGCSFFIQPRLALHVLWFCSSLVRQPAVGGEARVFHDGGSPRSHTASHHTTQHQGLPGPSH